MPGLSFLFKKRFHPSRMDNQKKVFITEENKKKDSEKEKELAVLVAKERELQMYEGLGKGPELDPRNASLKFMYHAPTAGKGKKDSQAKADTAAKEDAPLLDSNGDDEHVRAFRAKFLGSSNHSGVDQLADDEEPVIGPALPPPSSDNNDSDSDDSGNFEKELSPPQFAAQSTLERATGKKQRAVISAEEQGERHPALKNAPVDGAYAQQTAVRHKPFNAVIRNVRCLRCGQWGHYSGDRECLLRDHNPLDYERLMREDPMAHSLAQGSVTQPSNRHTDGGFRSTEISAQTARQYFRDNGVADYESSDPEGEFLRTLTRREKKLLLRRLQGLDREGNRSSSHPDSSDSESSSSSSSGSSSSSSSSDESDQKGHEVRRKGKRKHSKQRNSKGQKKRRKSEERSK